jgi:protein SCO1/2
LLRAAALPWLPAAGAHTNAGRVDPPRPAPPLPLTLHDGRANTLARLLAGHSTALQLMFTGCTATCPIQGALFASVQAGLARERAAPGAQLLSLSIDPLGDDAAALARWLRAAGAGPGWLGAVPSVAGVDTIFDFLGGRSRGPDRHTAQVYLFNARAELVLRSPDFPAPAQVQGWLQALARAG